MVFLCLVIPINETQESLNTAPIPPQSDTIINISPLILQASSSLHLFSDLLIHLCILPYPLALNQLELLMQVRLD